jgi:hypothetical protein
MHTHTHTHTPLLTYSIASTSMTARMSMTRRSRTNTSMRRSRMMSACARGAGQDEARMHLELAAGDDGRARGHRQVDEARALAGWRCEGASGLTRRGRRVRVEPGIKLAMMRTRINDGNEGAADPNQIWVRARTTTTDSVLGAMHRRERRELGHWRRRWEMGEVRGGGWRRWGVAVARWLSDEEWRQWRGRIRRGDVYLGDL